MLGEKIGESTGKVTSQRVLPNPGGGPKMETSFQASGKLLGVEENETGTYWAVVRPDGTLFGEGQGVMMGKEGDMATWVGQGVGTIGKGGAVSYRGAIYYQSASPKWSRLNSVAALFEFEVDGQGNSRSHSGNGSNPTPLKPPLEERGRPGSERETRQAPPAGVRARC